MNDKERVVMQQALNALESQLGKTHPFAHDLEKAAAIRTLREALAEQSEQEQVEQEPVARVDAWPHLDNDRIIVNLIPWDKLPIGTKLYAAPVQQAEQEPVAWLYDWEHEGEIVTGWVTQDFETTKFNNGHNVRPLYASPQPMNQEPVGKVLLHEGDVNAKGYLYNPLPEGTDLYAAPVRTKDLADDEILEATVKVCLGPDYFISVARAVDQLTGRRTSE